MIANSRALAATIERTANKLGATMPKNYADTLVAAHQLIADTEQLESFTAALNARVIAVLLTNKDPADDAEVQKLAIRRVIADAGVRVAGAQHADDLVDAALAQHADDLIKSWDSALHNDFDALTAAADVLDVPDLKAAADELGTLRKQGHIEQWAAAATAADRIKIGHDGVKAILTALHVQHQREHLPLLLAPDADLSVIDTANATAGKPDAWLLARIGAPLRLATVSDFIATIGAYTAAKQAQRRDFEQQHTRTGFDSERRREATAI